jgi:hypothetical protein
MKSIVILVALVIGGCTHEPPPLAQTPQNAPVWDLNPDRYPAAAQSPPGTNDLEKVAQ